MKIPTVYAHTMTLTALAFFVFVGCSSAEESGRVPSGTGKAETVQGTVKTSAFRDSSGDDRVVVVRKAPSSGSSGASAANVQANKESFSLVELLAYCQEKAQSLTQFERERCEAALSEKK